MKGNRRIHNAALTGLAAKKAVFDKSFKLPHIELVK